MSWPNARCSMANAVPLTPELEVRSPVVLTKAPAAVVVTSTWIWQVAPAPTEPPV